MQKFAYFQDEMEKCLRVHLQMWHKYSLMSFTTFYVYSCLSVLNSTLFLSVIKFTLLFLLDMTSLSGLFKCGSWKNCDFFCSFG